ncbi:MAG: protein-disulfide reductase DsbD N-terminal domain-containing protein, partial [Candidatus Thiodiazotropha sp.]
MHKRIDLTTMFLMLLVLSSLSMAAWNQEDLLLPDQAFQISGRTDGTEKLLVEWRIADGYYMYRDKIQFDSDTIGIEIGEPKLSQAKIKNDEFFGEVAVYRNKATAEIPIRRMQGSQETLLLKARSQGCADLGICFPPHMQ